MYVMLNSTRYPAVDYNLSFANQQYSRAYGDAPMKLSLFVSFPIIVVITVSWYVAAKVLEMLHKLYVFVLNAQG